MVRLTANGKIITSDTISNAVGLAILAMAEVNPETMELILAPLETVRAWAVGFVNDYAGQLRTAIGTNIPFQGDVYQLKEREVAGYLADPSPTAQKYPVLFAEAQARLMEVSAVAAEYAYNAQAWPVAIAQIEAMRLGTITAIKSAQSVAEIEAALSTIGSK